MSVYFAKVGRYIKVGYSQNPERRVANLWRSTTRYGRPWDLELNEPRTLLLAIEGGKDVESACHRALSDYMAGCEWFIDEPGVREFMESAARGEFPQMHRPGGEFEPLDYTHATESRRAEVGQMIARRVGEPSVDFGGMGVFGGAA